MGPLISLGSLGCPSPLVASAAFALLLDLYKSAEQKRCWVHRRLSTQHPFCSVPASLNSAFFLSCCLQLSLVHDFIESFVVTSLLCCVCLICSVIIKTPCWLSILGIKLVQALRFRRPFLFKCQLFIRSGVAQSGCHGTERVTAECRKLQSSAETEAKSISCPIWIQSHLGPDKNRDGAMGHRHGAPPSLKVQTAE